MPERRDSFRATRRLVAAILVAALCGCGEGETEERKPSAAEVRAYIAKIERDEAAHKAKAIRASRAKEKAKAKEHSARLRAED